MNKTEPLIKTKKVINRLTKSEIGSYVDASLEPPEPYRGGAKSGL